MTQLSGSLSLRLVTFFDESSSAVKFRRAGITRHEYVAIESQDLSVAARSRTQIHLGENSKKARKEEERRERELVAGREFAGPVSFWCGLRSPTLSASPLGRGCILSLRHYP